MSKINIYNDSFEKVGDEDFSIEISSDLISVPTVHQVVKASLANKRQGTASTKNRAVVRGGGAKPFKQKGTGRARQGSNVSPLLRGGGVVFGPTPRDFSQKVNKKMMLKAIYSVIADKALNDSLFVVDNFNSDGKTKTMFAKLNAKDMKSSLVVTEKSDDPALRAAKNLQFGNSSSVDAFSVYDAVKYKNLIIDKAAFQKLVDRLGA